MNELNLLAVLVAALSGFVIGGLWYSPVLFSRVWMKEAGLSEEQVRNGNQAKIFSLSFIFLLIMSYCLGMFLNAPEVTLASGALYGFLTGFGWIFFAYGVTSLFEQRSWKYVLINGGYWTVTFTVMGLILGGWR